MAAECHIRLIRRAVKEVLGMTALERDRTGMALRSLQEVAERIEAMDVWLPLVGTTSILQ